MHRLIVGLLALAAIAISGAGSASAEPRIALVVGNAAYAKGPLKTPIADAGLVAAALNSVGFEIVEGADLNQADFRARMREFLDKVQAAGPDTVALVYFAGYGLQFEGENYLVPVDARLERDSDISLDAIRVSDLMRPLAGAPGRAKVVILDGAHPLPFALNGAKLARGFGAMEAPPGTLVALSASPATLAVDRPEPYGVYATALAEMLRVPGFDLDTLFTRARVRTYQATEGAQTPWHASALTEPLVLTPGSPDAAAQDPTQGSAPPTPLVTRREQRPMRDLSAEEAYALAIERDDLPTYVSYVQTYPRSPYARRIWAQIRARREALAWERAVRRDSPESYWTYLRRYPGGVYAYDARRRLHRLSARDEPPPDFAPVEFADVPPPLPNEPVEIYGAYDPGPPPPRLMGPPPRFFVDLPPPPPPRGPRLLPIPVPIPIAPRVNAPPPRVFAPPAAAVSPSAPVSGPKPPGPPGAATAPPGGANPPGTRRPGAVTTTTPPGAPPPRAPVTGPKPPGAVTTTSPAGGPQPRSLTPGAKPPGVVTTTPPGGPPPKPPIGGPKPPGAVTTTAPAHVPPPRPPTQPVAKPPAAVTTTAPSGGPPPRPPGPPPAAAAPVRPPPPAAAVAKQPPPPAPRRKCPIVNGVENCKGT